MAAASTPTPASSTPLVDESHPGWFDQLTEEVQTTTHPSLAEEAGASHPNEDPKKAAARSVFTDWMRSLAIYMVVAVHIMVSILRVVDATDAQRNKVHASFRTLLQYGLPIFFYFSGRSSAFSNDRPLVFLYKKVMRLVLPLLAGLALVVVPTSYIGRKWRDCKPDEDNFFKYYGFYWANFIHCSAFEWLWFLPVLFVLAVANMTFFMWLKKRYAVILDDTPNGFLKEHDLKAFIGFALLIASLFGLFAAIGWPLGWVWMSVVFPYIWSLLCVIFLPFIRRINFLTPVFAGPAFGSFIMAATLDNVIVFGDGNRLVPSFFFYNLHYLQGFIDQVFFDEYIEFRETPSHLRFRPLALLCVIALLAICSPGTDENVGYLFLYPIYTDRWLKISYVLGTWIWLALFVRYGEAWYNHVFEQFQYKHVLQSSIVIYIVHWLFIDTILVILVVPAKLGFVSAIFIVTPLTVLLCWLFYVFVLKVPYLGLLFGFAPPKMKKRKEESHHLRTLPSGDSPTDVVVS